MGRISIDEVDLSDKLLATVRNEAGEEGKRIAMAFIEEYKKKLDYPDLMTYTQAARYMNTSFNSIKYKFVEKMGLPVVMIDGYRRIRKSDVDDFLEKHKKRKKKLS